MITIKQLRSIETLEDLEALGIGHIFYDISERGGGLGFYSSDVAEAFGVDSVYLPRKFGAFCNYLGGVVRGKIVASDFDYEKITGKKAQLLEELANACVRVYTSIDDKYITNDMMEGYVRVEDTVRAYI